MTDPGNPYTLFSPANQQPIERYTDLLFPARLLNRYKGYTPVRYSWEELEINPEGGVYRRVEGGRTGTETDAWAVELNNVDTDIDQIVWLRFRGVETDGRIIYEFTICPPFKPPLVAMAQVAFDMPLTTWEGRYYGGQFPEASLLSPYPDRSFGANIQRWDDGYFGTPPVLHTASGSYHGDYRYVYNANYANFAGFLGPRRIALICGPYKPLAGQRLLCTYQDTLTNGIYVYHANQEQGLNVVGATISEDYNTPTLGSYGDARGLGLATQGKRGCFVMSGINGGALGNTGLAVPGEAFVSVKGATEDDDGVMLGPYNHLNPIYSTEATYQTIGGDKQFLDTLGVAALAELTASIAQLSLASGGGGGNLFYVTINRGATFNPTPWLRMMIAGGLIMSAGVAATIAGPFV